MQRSPETDGPLDLTYFRHPLKGFIKRHPLALRLFPRFPLYLCGTKGSKSDIYQSMEEIRELGVNTIDRISDVAAYVKLVIAYNQQQLNPARVIYSNLFFEFL